MKARRAFVLGVGTVLASAVTMLVGVASASAFTTFNYEVAPVKLESTPATATWGTRAGSASGTAILTGESAVTHTATQLMTPQYSGFSFLSTLNIPLKTNGCQFMLHASITVDIVCPEGKFIEFEASLCQIKIGSQSSLASITYENIGSGTSRSVNTWMNLGGIKYSESSACPLGGGETRSDGTYTQANARVFGRNLAGTKTVGMFMS